MFLEFEGIENARELGGLTRPDGRRIKENVLFRTGHLEQASEGDIRRLEEIGVACVIDLRDNREQRRHTDRPVPGAEMLHIPAMADLRVLFPKEVDDASLVAEEVRREFTQLYAYLARSPESLDAYEEFFRVLLRSGGKPVLWHCTQGKDRTGVAAMLLLIALGFEQEQVLAEYMLTNVFAQKQLDAVVAAGKEEAELALLREVLLVFRDNAVFYLRCLELEYGSVYNFLELALGIGPDEIETLEKYYLE